MGGASEVQQGLSDSDAAEREGVYIISAHRGRGTAVREITGFEDQDTSGGG